jgi:hypothetical protein
VGDLSIQVGQKQYHREQCQLELADIKEAIEAGRVRITDHAYEEANADLLKFDEIYFSAMHGVVIEEYMDDSPYPSVLILGQTFGGDPVHSVWAFNCKVRKK